MIRILLIFALVGVTVTAALADTVIVNETFDGYVDDTAFRAAWVPTVGNGNSPANPADVTSGILTTDNTLFPGIQGKAIDHIGAATATMVNQYLPASGGPAPGNTVGPNEEQSLFLSADIFESGLGNERMTVGLRNRTSTQNILELGIYNAVTCDATVPGCTPSVSPVPPETPGFRNFVGYSFRSAIFQSFGGDLVAEPNWQVFILPQELDRTTDTDEFVTIGDIGAGWHRFSANITLTTVTYELDLFRDGKRNTSITPDENGDRPGTPGVDASITFELAVTNNGFDSLRIGGPSGVSSIGSGQMAFDNIVLKLVDSVAANTPDFNGDGTVNAADYTRWRNNLGLTGTGTQATGDANGDTNVDATDYDLWKAAYGDVIEVGSGGGVGVPEPAALVLWIAGATALGLARRRR